MVAVIILQQVLARMSKWREQDIKCKKPSHFGHFAIGRGLNLLSINNRTNFFGGKKKKKKKSKMNFSGVSVF